MSLKSIQKTFRKLPNETEQLRWLLRQIWLGKMEGKSADELGYFMARVSEALRRKNVRKADSLQ